MAIHMTTDPLVLDHRDFDGYVLKSVELKSVNSVHRRVGSHSSYLLWASTRRLRRWSLDPRLLRPARPDLFEDGGEEHTAPQGAERPDRGGPHAGNRPLLGCLHHRRHPD